VPGIVERLAPNESLDALSCVISVNQRLSAVERTSPRASPQRGEGEHSLDAGADANIV